MTTLSKELSAKQLDVLKETVPKVTRDPNELDNAFAVMSKARAGALFILGDPMFMAHRVRIVGLAARSRLPAMYGNGEFVDVGGLMINLKTANALGLTIPQTLLLRADQVIE